MITEQQVKSLILESISKVKNSKMVHENFDVNDNTALIGMKAVWDSIAFVGFTTDLEERIEDAIGKEVVLNLHEIHELNEDKSVLKVGNLTKIVVQIINKKYADA